MLSRVAMTPLLKLKQELTISWCAPWRVASKHRILPFAPTNSLGAMFEKPKFRRGFSALRDQMSSGVFLLISATRLASGLEQKIVMQGRPTCNLPVDD